MDIYNTCIKGGLSKSEASEYMINTLIIRDKIRKCWLVGKYHGYNMSVINSIMKLDICANLIIVEGKLFNGIDYFICLRKNENWVKEKLKSGKNSDIIYGELLGFPCPTEFSLDRPVIGQFHEYMVIYNNIPRNIYAYTCPTKYNNYYDNFTYSVTIFKRICNLLYKYKTESYFQYLVYNCIFQINNSDRYNIQIIWDANKTKRDNIKNINRAISEVKESNIANIYKNYINSTKNIKTFRQLDKPITRTIQLFKNDKNNICYYP